MAGQAAGNRRQFGIGFVGLVAALASLSCDPIPSAARGEDLPKRILLIRHAEKPAAEENSVHLNAAGKARAEALPRLFQAAKDRPDPLPTPDFLFAARSSKHSDRPVETVTPLAKKLKLQINVSYAEEDSAMLVREIRGNPKYAGKTVLICWRHGDLPELAGLFGAAGVPKHWPGTAFDRVWQIEYDAGGKAAFRDLPQKLMNKDAQK